MFPIKSAPKEPYAGGGRYDGLVSALGGQPTPGLGFGSGIERLLLVMQAQGVEIPRPESIHIFVASIGDAADRSAQQLVHRLRLLGFSADRDTTGRGLKAQMKYSDRIGAGYTMVLGDDELASGTVKIKNMATGEQSPCLLCAEAIAEFLRHSVKV